MGKIAITWELAKQSFKVLRSDKQLMLLPILTAISCIVVTVVMAAGGGLALYPQIKAAEAAGTAWHAGSTMTLLGLFMFYVANYYVIVFFNTALVGAASIRMEGGTPTLKEGLSLAWERRGVILQWAILAATVGLVLKLIEERVKLVGQIVTRLIGVAWTLASYFVVPVLTFEELGPVDALKRSASLFAKTWGEEVVAGFSFGLIFFLLGMAGILLPIMGSMLLGATGVLVGLVLMGIYLLLLAVVSAAVHGIFMAALYRYANQGEVPPGFRRENFSMAWQTK